MENKGHQQQQNHHYDDPHSPLGAEGQTNTDSADEDDVNDEDYIPEPELPSKRKKRHTPAQIQELRAAFEKCNHPDEKTRQALGTKIGLEARQVRFWFQNQRSQMQAKSMVEDGKLVQQEHAALLAENVSLRHAMLAKCCSTCGGGMVSAEPSPEKRRLLAENSRLKDEHMRATALVHKVLLEAPSSTGHPTTTHPMLSSAEGWASRSALLRLAEASMEQFLMLANKGEPLWVPTPDGEALSYQMYQKKMFPVQHGVCPNGFFREATREAGMVRATAADIVDMLTDVNRWSEMFPGVVASVTAGDVICGGVSATRDGLIQLMNAELWVQSPRLRNRGVSFLRYSRLTAKRQWAVMDVSVESIQRSHKVDLNVDSSVVPAWNTDCRLLPSGCLVEDMGNGCCKVTWIVHAEYNETMVPTMFRPLFRSGRALGAHRWLASLQRQCEFLAVMRSSHVPSNHNTSAALSSMGRRGILELAQRMMASFYSAVSGPVTQPSSNIDEWHGGTGSGAERIDAAVRMVTWKKAGSMGGHPAGLVLSASTTVWMPNTLPQLVFEYLCNDQRRGEWDVLANGSAVEELVSIAMGHLDGNAVSVLRPNSQVTDGTNSKILILQEACVDASCSMVVYAPVQEESMRAIMNGGDHAAVFLLPSGFAVLPDGHGKARHVPCSSSATPGHRNTAGSLITVACQALLPASPSGDAAAGAFDDVGRLLCRAIKNIKAAVTAKLVVPTA